MTDKICDLNDSRLQYIKSGLAIATQHVGIYTSNLHTHCLEQKLLRRCAFLPHSIHAQKIVLHSVPGCHIPMGLQHIKK